MGDLGLRCVVQHCKCAPDFQENPSALQALFSPLLYFTMLTHLLPTGLFMDVVWQVSMLFLLLTLLFVNLLTACPLFDVESSFIAFGYLEFVFSHRVYCFSNFSVLLLFQIVWLIHIPCKLFMNIVQINFLYPHFLQVYCA